MGVSLEGNATDVRLHLTRGDGTETWTLPAASLDLRHVSWVPSPAPVPEPGDIGRIRRLNPWIPIIRTEDFIHRRLRRT